MIDANSTVSTSYSHRRSTLNILPKKIWTAFPKHQSIGDTQSFHGGPRKSSPSGTPYQSIGDKPLTVLFKFIKPFNGDRSELTTFRQNVNSAFSLAVLHQRPPLLLFVVSQLSTSVVKELELSEVHTWHELKDKLKHTIVTQNT